MTQIRRICRVCMIAVSSLGLCFPAIAAKLEQVSIIQQQPLVLKFTISGQGTHRVFSLHHPERIVIDLNHTTTTINPASIARLTPVISQVRLGHPHPQTLRLVLESKQPLQFKVSPQRLGWQLRLIPNGGHSRSIAKPAAMVVHDLPAHPRDVVIVLDPGHGGKDPGAIGSNHRCEKQVVLAMAKRLKTSIDQQPGMRAVLTRTGDYYIGLRQRMAIARQRNADLFIAIHADAFEDHHSHGASVFALSQRGATSEAARWLAAKENYSELGGVNLSKIHDQNGVIRSVLIDLSQTATISASLRLGKHVLHGLHRMTTLHSSKVEQARFMVLKSPDIPSLLIETGFISNPHEENNLSDPRYQAKMSQAIVNGIKTYFWDYPPHGSKIALLAARTPLTTDLQSRHHRL